jgi:hypothetical protein
MWPHNCEDEIIDVIFILQNFVHVCFMVFVVHAKMASLDYLCFSPWHEFQGREFEQVCVDWYLVKN